MIRRPPRSQRTDTRLPYTTLFRSVDVEPEGERIVVLRRLAVGEPEHRAVALVPHQIETRMSREAVLGHRMRDILHPDHSAVGHPDHREQNRRIMRPEGGIGVAHQLARSEERRVGKEGGSKGRSRWSPYH